MHARRGQRLLGVQAQHEGHVEAEEIDQLGRRIDLGRVHGLGLAEQGRGIERRAPRAGGKLGRFQENRGTPGRGKPRPVGRRPPRGLDGVLDLRGIGEVGERQDVAMIVRLDRLLEPAGAYLVAANEHGKLDPSRLQLAQSRPQRRALG